MNRKELIEWVKTCRDKCHEQGQAFEISVYNEVITALSEPLPDEVAEVLNLPKNSILRPAPHILDLIERQSLAIKTLERELKMETSDRRKICAAFDKAAVDWLKSKQEWQAKTDANQWISVDEVLYMVQTLFGGAAADEFRKSLPPTSERE